MSLDYAPRRPRGGRAVRAREERARLGPPSSRPVLPLLDPSAVTVASPDDYRHARVRASLALAEPGVPPLLARSRYTVAAVRIPEDARLRAFRDEADARGVAHLLPPPPWEVTPEEVARSRARLEQGHRPSTGLLPGEVW